MMESFGLHNPNNFNYGLLATQFKPGVLGYLEDEDNLSQIRHSVKTDKWMESMLKERHRQKISSDLSRNLVIHCDGVATSFIVAFPIKQGKGERDRVVMLFFMMSLLGFISLYLSEGFYYA